MRKFFKILEDIISIIVVVIVIAMIAGLVWVALELFIDMIGLFIH